MNKEEIRKKLKKILKELPEERKKAASKALFHHLIDQLGPFENVLSFASFQNEIDTTLLNHFLARTGRLILPKMEKNDLLELYRVADVHTDLQVNSLGISEPNPHLCKKVPYESIQVVLVPALGFDKNNYRIGYGKGIYDRFLAKIPQCTTIGIGFVEQQIDSLPLEKTDLSLSDVILF